MTMNSQPTRDPVIELATSRRRMLQHASALFSDAKSVPFVEQYDALPKVSGLLVGSLEEVKVAEEELIAQNHALAEQREALERQIRRYRQLFEHAPFALVVTDLYGTVQEINAAATTLLKRSEIALERKPIAALVARELRSDFRDRLNKLRIVGAVHDWRFVIQRPSDAPLEVSASVAVVPGVGHTDSGLLYWLIQPAASDNHALL